METNENLWKFMKTIQINKLELSPSKERIKMSLLAHIFGNCHFAEHFWRLAAVCGALHMWIQNPCKIEATDRKQSGWTP